MICIDNSILYLFSFIFSLSLATTILVIFYKGENTEKKETQITTTPLNTLPVEIVKPPSVFPERAYRGPFQTSLNGSKIGYVFNSSHVYPLYLTRIDKRYYYYIIDSSRNNVEIPITRNLYQELYNEDIVQIPELGGSLTVKLYEYQGNIYI